MNEQRHVEVDTHTGTATTGHEWDGIRELNTPLPRWWLWLFYVTIVWSVGYWIVYPSWPLVSSYTVGAFGWQSRDASGPTRRCGGAGDPRHGSCAGARIGPSVAADRDDAEWIIRASARRRSTPPIVVAGAGGGFSAGGRVGRSGT